MKTAKVFRVNAKTLKSEFEQDNYLEPDEVQFELVEFSDGTIAQRWLTHDIEGRSTVVWQSMEALKRVHIYAHPDYGTRIEWSDGTVEEV